MAYRLLDDEKERLEEIVYELENASPEVLRARAAELLLLRKLHTAVRDSVRSRSPRVQKILDRMPRGSDRAAWNELTAAEKAEAAAEFSSEPGSDG